MEQSEFGNRSGFSVVKLDKELHDITMRLSTQMIRVDLESMNKSRRFRRLNWYWNANSRRRQCTIRKQCKIDSMFHAVHLFTNGSWKASKYGN